MAPMLSGLSNVGGNGNGGFGFGKRKKSSGPSFLPFLVNGYTDLTVTQEPSVVNWTVPDSIGKIQVRMYGANGGQTECCPNTPGAEGGYIDVQFEVTPGEIFTFARTVAVAGNQSQGPYGSNNSTAVAFWLYNGATSITQGNLWAIVGGGGSNATKNGYSDNSSGGRGGSSTGESVTVSSFGAPNVNGNQIVCTGGTNSSGGVRQTITVPSGQIGNWNGNGNGYRNYSTGTSAFGGTGSSPPRSLSTQGQAIYGGEGGSVNQNEGRWGGQGGSGWYGGCGGVNIGISWEEWGDGADNPSNQSTTKQSAFGAGGSSRIQIPSGRNPVTNTNQMGRTGGPSLPTDVRIIY